MYCRFSGDIAMNLMPIPNTALSSMSKLSDHTNLAITGMDFAPGGLRTMVKLCPSSGPWGKKYKHRLMGLGYYMPKNFSAISVERL